MPEQAKAQILPFSPAHIQVGQEESNMAERIDSNAEIGSDEVHFANAPVVSVAVVGEQARMVEAIIFASSELVSQKSLLERLPEDANLAEILEQLQKNYADRGINLVKIGDCWGFRTADDLGFLLQREAVETKKLSRAALEVMAIIGYHQPVTRAEIEEIRGVATSKGTLDVLMETQWVKMRGRRRTPGRPITYGTTAEFLDHFGLEQLRDLPGLDELKGAGLLQSQLPSNFSMPIPDDDEELGEDEEPFTSEDLEELGLLPPSGE